VLLALSGLPCTAHELRNEVVEELIPDLVRKSRGELDVELGNAGRNRGRENEKGRRWGDRREADMKCKVAAWLLPARSGADTA